MHDEKIEQLARQKELLTEDQIEAVRDEIREAADGGEELSFVDAAVRKDLLTAEQAEALQKEAEQEISTSETEDISGAIGGEPAAQDEAEHTGESAAEGPAPAEEEDQAASETEEQAAQEPQKQPYLAIAIGIAIVIALITLVAIFNRKREPEVSRTPSLDHPAAQFAMQGSLLELSHLSV